MNRLSTLSFAAILLSSTLDASAQLAPTWTASTGAVSWLRTTSAGALVACTAEGLKGIDPVTGKVSWTVKELANAPESSYAEVDRSPFITLAPAGAPEDLIIVEPFAGTVAFNSKAAGMQRIASQYFLYANNAIVLTGQGADKKAMMACVDMATGKVRWTKDDAFSKLTSCSSAGPDAILLSTLFFAYKLDANTGAELWKQTPDPKFAGAAGLMSMLDKGGANLGMQTVGSFVTSNNAPELCFMALQQSKQSTKTDSKGNKTTETTYTTFVNAFKISDGSYAWEKPLQFNQQLGTIVPLKKGLMIGAADKGSVEMLDYRTGQGLWGKNGKGINVKGPLNGAVEVGDRTLLTSGGDKAVAEMVDAAGMDLWKKPVKLDGAIGSVMLLNGAVLIASAEEMEVVDITTGESKLPNTFKGGSGLVARDGAEVCLFNTKDGLLYKLSGSSTASAASSVPLVFEGKEKATRLEASDAGLVVTSEQNMALLARDGSIKYQKYFPAPRESGLVRALKYASAVRAAYYTAAFGYTSAAFGAVSQSIQVEDAQSAMARDITGAVSDVYAEGAKMGADATKRFLQEANARFKATASTNDIHYMLSEAGKNAYALQAVRKADGTLSGTVPLGNDKTPKYEVDGFVNTVYLAEGTGVLAFKL